VAPELHCKTKPKVRIVKYMSKITLLLTWATFAGMTAYADPCSPASPEEPCDPFAVALAVMDNEASAPEHTVSAILPPLEDYLHPEGQSSVPSAALADGKVSSFRIGAEGLEKVTVSEDGGLWVGVIAVDSHVIEIAEIGEVKAGTYTLIDYEGSIGGAGFKGLKLHGAPHLHAKLVNNTAETKIELVVSDARELEWPKAVIGLVKLGLSSLWAPLDKMDTTRLGDEATKGEIAGILGRLGFKSANSTNDALQ